MHSAVLQNKKYIKFANQNTVEVLALGSLKKGIEKGDRKAATYEAKGPDGQKTQFMVSWPNLTAEQIYALRSSKAGSYNNTGGIPKTILVNPHTLERVTFLKSRSSKGLMDEIADYRKQLTKDYGKAKLKRKDIHAIAKVDAKVVRALAKGDVRGAVGFAKKAEDKVKQWPTAAKDMVAKVRARITEYAGDQLDKIEELADSRPKNARRKLAALMPAIKGTDLEDRARELVAKLNAQGNK